MSMSRARILVVDDEPAIGRALQRNLAPHHDVVAMTSARMALQRVLGGDEFDVVICDLLMPDMTGMQFYEALEEAKSALVGRVIFFTGGAYTSTARDFLNRVQNPRIEKPFQLSELLVAIRALLVGPGAPLE
jgi:DNA-binding NtrC family response regulator